ncbi:MAG: monofunctional biosynthetic peptidoglycan transglycosylase [Boseongicola sp.]
MRQDTRPETRKGTRRVWWFRLARALAITTAVYYVALIAAYRFIDPPSSNWMLIDTISGVGVNQTWIPIDEMSPHVIRAVVASEDGRFCKHWGVDWAEIYHAVANADQRGPRGASTITMQTAKNLFLWPGRSYIRKAIELPMTYLIELFWPKRRILEVYLNIAEWAPGVYGIEAASFHHFKIGAHRLSKHQATLLAASLPNPAKRRAGKPGPKTRKHASKVRKRMGRAVEGTQCVFE